jgi:DNA-binding NarL/FixJ family response regulator
VSLRCLIVDDNLEFLHAARGLLEQEGIDVVGLAQTPEEATEQIAALRPDVTLIDVDLGTASGLELARRLTDGAPAGDLILISTQTQDDLAELAAATPAIGCISKPLLSAAAIEQLVATAHS